MAKSVELNTIKERGNLTDKNKEQAESVFKGGKEQNQPGSNKGCLVYLVAFGVMLILAAIMTYLN